jgi:ATP-dependent protease ClpP protease subunit
MASIKNQQGVSQFAIPMAVTPYIKQTQAVINEPIFRLYGEVEGPEFYSEWIDIMDSCTEHDVVHMYINTPGGDLDGAISLIHAMRRCEATVITYADGNIASAGTIILFAGDSIVVQPYAHFMAHDASSGGYGKISENKKSNDAVSSLVEQLYRDLYEPYITPKEIDSILAGIDLYLTADELKERVEKAQQIESLVPESEE